MCLLVCLLLTGCEATRYVSNKDKLIKNEAQFKGNNALSSDKLKTGVKSKPNRRIIIPKVYLHFYNLGHSLEEDSSRLRKIIEKVDKRQFIFKEIPEWLKNKLGEEAHVVNELQLIEDCKNLENIYFANGFFHARVRYEVVPTFFNPRKAIIRFHVEEGLPHYINRLTYETKDTAMVLLLTGEMSKALVRSGERYNEDLLTEERNRITEFLREKGYFRFLPSQISYQIDTLPEAIQHHYFGKNKIPKKYLNVSVFLPDSSYTYSINRVKIRLRSYADDSFNVVVNPDSLTAEDLYQMGLRPGRYDPRQQINYLTTDNAIRLLNFNTLHDAIQFRRGMLFSLSASKISQRRLQEMGIFNNAIIRFYANDTNHTLTAETDLILQKRFGYKVGFEAFQADQFNLGSNYPGLGSNVEFSIRNAFRRAELITSSANGSVFFINQRSANDSLASLRFFLQWGGRVSMRVPRFWFIQPLANTIQLKKWATFLNPGTSVTLLYRRDNPLIYVRSTFQAEFSYQWFHEERRPRNKITQYSIFTPFNMTLVRSQYNLETLVTTITGKGSITELNANELRLIEFLLQDLTRRYVSYSSYYRTITKNYGLERKRNTWFLRTGLEMGGNIPYLFDFLGNKFGKGDDSYTDASVELGGTTYSYGQFFKSSLEGKYFIPFGKNKELVSRCFVGYSTRFGGTKQLLFENRFYSGGTNSVRGWQSNALGPGSVPPKANTGFFIGGEYKFEANLEYRQDLVSPTELALFVDAGNVWFSQSSNFADPKGKLAFNNLGLGIAAGIGLRFDLTFVILRFDIGQQIYAPDRKDWVVKRIKDIGFPGIQYNLAIGYPF